MVSNTAFATAPRQHGQPFLFRAHVLVVSDNKEALGLGDASFELPSNHDLLYPFSEVTFAQLFAFYLARLRNINPDNPVT